MNENLDLTKILNGCPTGTKLYSTLQGEVDFVRIDIFDVHPIVVSVHNKYTDITIYDFYAKTVDTIVFMTENVLSFHLKNKEIGQSLKDFGISRRRKSLTSVLFNLLIKY